MIRELDASLVVAAKDVFCTMLGWSVETSVELQGDGQPAPFSLGPVSGCIGFGGELTGSLFLSCTEHLAAEMGRAILHQECGATEISDVLGELTNMLAGSCKSRLSDAGRKVFISIPNIIRGTGIRAVGKDIQFLIRRQFSVAGLREEFAIILLGKFD